MTNLPAHTSLWTRLSARVPRLCWISFVWCLSLPHPPHPEPAPSPCLLPELGPCGLWHRVMVPQPCPAVLCQPSPTSRPPECRSWWVLAAQMPSGQRFHSLNELMQHPWKPSPQGTAELGQISPGLPSCRAACKQLIAFLINVNHAHGGSQRRARHPLPLLQSSFVFQQCSRRAETKCAHKGTASTDQKPLCH